MAFLRWNERKLVRSLESDDREKKQKMAQHKR
jgi:hypothetical protein